MKEILKYLKPLFTIFLCVTGGMMIIIIGWNIGRAIAEFWQYIDQLLSKLDKL
jgi:hypothetical protein